MNRIVVFILGFIAGAAVMFGGLFVFAYIFAEHSASHKYIQYVEIKDKHGKEVKLHTYMPKDSVKMLLGSPDKTSLGGAGLDDIEDWTYEFERHGDYRQIYVTFENGEMTSIHEI